MKEVQSARAAQVVASVSRGGVLASHATQGSNRIIKVLVVQLSASNVHQGRTVVLAQLSAPLVLQIRAASRDQVCARTAPKFSCKCHLEISAHAALVASISMRVQEWVHA
jgi:hypothetical protein